MEKLADIEIDAIAVIEKEFTKIGRPYPAYLMRKVLNLLAPSWREKHPFYQHLEKEAMLHS